MLLVLSLALAAAGPPYLNGGIGRAQDDPNVTLRVLAGGPASPVPSAPTLAGSFGEALTFTRATSATCTPASGQVYTVASGVPCITEQGYRADPQSTNLLLRSGSTTVAPWTSGAVTCAAPTITANTADVTAPDGTSTATKVIFSACSGAGVEGGANQSYVATAAGYAHSIYLRTLSGSYAVNLVATITGAEGAAVSCPVTSTWSRCTLSFTATATNWNIEVGYDGRGVPGETAIGAGTVYVWGGQAELGSSSTSYIPTLGTTVQRNGEALAGTMAVPTTTGCMALDFYPTAPLSTNMSVLTFDPVNDGLIFQMNASTLLCRVVHANTFYDATVPPPSWVAGQRVHMSMGYDAAGTTCTVTTPSGTAVGTQPTIQLPTAASGSYFIGSDRAPASQAQGSLSNIAFGTSKWSCP